MVGGLAGGGAWDTLVEGRGKGSHARDSSSRGEGWWCNRGGTKNAGDDGDSE